MADTRHAGDSLRGGMGGTEGCCAPWRVACLRRRWISTRWTGSTAAVVYASQRVGSSGTIWVRAESVRGGFLTVTPATEQWGELTKGIRRAPANQRAGLAWWGKFEAWYR